MFPSSSSTVLQTAFQLLQDYPDEEAVSLAEIIKQKVFREALEAVRQGPELEPDPERQAEGPSPTEMRALIVRQRLHGCYHLPAKVFLRYWCELVRYEAPEHHARWKAIFERVCKTEVGGRQMKDLMMKSCPDESYEKFFEQLEREDPEAVYPTSLYRQARGEVSEGIDSRRIEAVLQTTVTTEVQIIENILDPGSQVLRRIFLPLERCVCLVDAEVEKIYHEAIYAYFNHHRIRPLIHPWKVTEAEKGFAVVEEMLGSLKQAGVFRGEPVLVMGGGVMQDLGGLACSLYHRGIPYVSVPTSSTTILSGGPSPLTSCNAAGYKNLLGTYHPPLITIIDRKFLQSVPGAEFRQGLAELLKLGIIADREIFEMMEHYGPELLESHLGASGLNQKVSQLGHQVMTRALNLYLELEYGSPFETHQCRPQAYGRTWSPGMELPGGMLHGHALSCDMGFSAFLSHREGWLADEDLERILDLISDFGLSLYHPIMDEQAVMVDAQERIIQRRGGQLMAPVPKGGIGKAGYLEHLETPILRRTLDAYKTRCSVYPRGGLGVEPHHTDNGYEDPAITFG